MMVSKSNLNSLSIPVDGQRPTYPWLCLLAAMVLLAQATAVAQEKESQPTRLLDRQPFDRITLDAASGGEVIETQLLELPNRQVPNPFPAQGSLELRRLSEPSVLYKVPWNSVVRVEFYEGILLQEAVALARAKDLDQSYEYLSFLHKNYPDLPGLVDATARYLRQDAQVSYGKQDYEATLTVLLSLYDLDPQHRGLKSMVEAVTDRMIEKYLADRDYGAARSVLDMSEDGFPDLQASNLQGWQEKFEQGAKRQLALAQSAIEQEQYSEARRAVRQAMAILPNARGAEAMMREIDQRSPQIIVAVDQLMTDTANRPLDWSISRIAQLTNPKLVTLTDFGAEGGIYDCRWGKFSSDDTGLLLTLDLNQTALSEGFTAEAIALQLLQRTESQRPEFRADFAGLLDAVEIGQGDQVTMQWQQSHVRPEALLDLPLRKLTDESVPGAFEVSFDDELPDQLTFTSTQSKQDSGPSETIIERYYDNDDLAIADLVNGEIDVIARVPSWQVSRLEETPGVVVVPYRLPTVHALIPNYEKPLMGRREFRRAICYGIDRTQILEGILLGGERRAGFQVLSAPLPAGVTITDPVGYAYNHGRQPRSYEPRLAAVLAAVARNSLAKIAAQKAKQEKAAAEGEAAADAQEENETANEDSKDKTKQVKAEPLLLIHPANPTATTACQTIKLQLGAIGIPVSLQALDPDADELPEDFDLRYAELAIWEPIVDAGRLLGPEGIAGSCSSSMSLALRDVEQARNWKEVRSRLQEVHEVAFNDLPVIPLWQTIDFFAHRQSLSGVGMTPVTLYQNVNQWKRGSQGGGR